MSNESLGICIIDSGVNETALYIGKISTNMEITRKLQVRRRPSYDAQVINHATVCAAIIRKYAPDAVLHSMKILNSREKSTIEQLKAAVLWCLQNNIRIIHMSIGSIIHSDFDEMRLLANTAWKQGAVIVAACNNNGKITYPATLDRVIGVKCDRGSSLVEGEYIYNSISLDGVEVTACSKHSLTLPGGKGFNTVCTNSYAAPFITALVYNILRDNPCLAIGGIKEALRRGAKEGQCDLTNVTSSRYIDWVENALIVDFGDNSELLSTTKTPFNITDKIAPNLSECKTVLEGIRKSADKADTIILLPPNCENSSNKASIISLFEEIGSLNKNIVYLGNDDIGIMPRMARKKRDIQVWDAGIYRSFDYKGYLKKEIEVPTIIIYENLQYLLIELLQKLVIAFSQDSYHAVGVSDSTFGILAGLEYLHPRYAAQAYKDRLQALYNLHDPDVMLVGFTEKISFEAAVKEVKPEISLVALDKTEAAKREFMLAPEDESSRLICIVPEELARVPAYGENTVVLSYTKEADIGRIYKCILSMLGIYS
jgi:hypothetical protein